MSKLIKYLSEKWHNVLKKDIHKEDLDFYETIEGAFRTGFLRVLYCLLIVELRTSELQFVTKLPTANLVTLLQYLQETGLVKKYSKKVEEPRKGEVSFYKLTREGKILSKGLLMLPDNSLAVSNRDDLLEIGKKLRLK